MMLNSAKKRARIKGVPFDLTVEDLEFPEVCPVLGIPISRSPNGGWHWPSSPSLDRINPALGYTKDNIRIISFRANTLKNNASVKELELVLEDARRL